jgi:hypothetical protein
VRGGLVRFGRDGDVEDFPASSSPLQVSSLVGLRPRMGILSAASSPALIERRTASARVGILLAKRQSSIAIASACVTISGSRTFFGSLFIV